MASYLVMLSAVALLLMGCPLYAVLFGSSLYLFFVLEVPWVNLIVQFEKLQSQDFIIAIPVFTLAGVVLARSKCPDRILVFFQSTLGFVRGFEILFSIGLLVTFTALTGASGVGILALGGLLMPILRKSNLSERFSLGLLTASGGLGLLLVPSLPVIIYAIVATQSQAGTLVDIKTLFQAAFVPLLLIVGMFVVYSLFIQRSNNKPQQQKPFSWNEAWKGIWTARYELPLPILIYGGIYTGLFSVVETSFIVAFYSLLVAFVFQRDLRLRRDLINVVSAAATLSGALFMVIVGAMVFKEYFVQQKIPENLFNALSPYLTSKILFLLAANVFLLVAGCFLDIFSAILILLPILLPIVERYQIDPYHFAIVFLVNLEIGYITPPVGMNLFISSVSFRKPVVLLYKATLPFLGMMVAALLLLTYVPILSTFLTKDKEAGRESVEGSVGKQQALQAAKPLPVLRSVGLRSMSGDATLTFEAPDLTDFDASAVEVELRGADFEWGSVEDLDFAEVFVASLSASEVVGAADEKQDYIGALKALRVEGLSLGDLKWVVVRLRLGDATGPWSERLEVGSTNFKN